MNSRLAVLLVLTLPLISAMGETWKVPGDFNHLQDAVNGAAAGDVIQCKGTFAEQVEISGKTDLTLSGKATIDGQGSCLIITNCQGILISGLGFIGAEWDAVRISGSADVSLVKCMLSEGQANGMVVQNSNRVRIEKCRISGVEGHGIYLPRSGGPLSDDCIIQGNSIWDCGEDGVQCPGTRTIQILKNKVRTCGGDGIAFRMNGGAQSAHVEGNTLSDLRGSGIVEGGVDSLCLKNKISRCDLCGIEMHGADGVAEANSIKTVGDDGVWLNGPRSSALGNKISDAGFFFPAGGFQTGTGVEADNTNHTIAGNKIKAVRNHGVHLWDADDSDVVGNKMSACGEDGVQVLGNGNTITDNKVSKVGDDGFDVRGTGNTLTGNSAKGCPGADLEDFSGPGANTYMGNRFGTTMH